MKLKILPYCLVKIAILKSKIVHTRESSPHASYSVHVEFYVRKNEKWKEYLCSFIFLPKIWHKHGIKMSSLHFPKHEWCSQFYFLCFCLSVQLQSSALPRCKTQQHFWIHSICRHSQERGCNKALVLVGFGDHSVNSEIMNSVSPCSNKWHP